MQVRRFGLLVIDEPQRRVMVDQRAVALTSTEFNLPAALADAPGVVLTRSHLLREVWGYAEGVEFDTRTVDVHVRNLRQKLGSEGRRVETVRGVGYRLEPETLNDGEAAT
jgi:two-component system alkaline phosphatase synthesis response regulator PhoP